MALDSTVRLSTQTVCVLIGLEGLSFYTVLFPWSLPGMCLTFFFFKFPEGHLQCLCFNENSKLYVIPCP